MSTPRFVLSCLTFPCPLSSCQRTQFFPYPLPLFYCLFQVRYDYDQAMLCHPDAYLYDQDAYIYAKITISAQEPLCLQVYLYSREASGKFDFRVFYSLSLRPTLAVPMPVVYFHSTHHSDA